MVGDVVRDVVGDVIGDVVGNVAIYVVRDVVRYVVGDVVRLETNVNELLFKNETKNTEYKMKLSLTEDEWKQAHFCAFLNGYDDLISIL